jgi:hypothetical protein
MSTMRTYLQRERARGQALVEFSLSILIFMVMLMGIFDVGRAIFMYNGVSEAAREIARRTSVYPYPTIANADNLGDSDQTKATIETQLKLVPGMNPVPYGSPNFECVDIAGNPSTSDRCGQGTNEDYVQVMVSATYQPITLLGITGPITLQATSTAAFPKAQM